MKAWLVRSYQLLPLAGSREVAQFLDEDRVGAAQQVGVLLLDLAEDAHAQARARERMAIHHAGRQAQRHAELADLVLEQVAQRLQQLQAQLLGQAADVVVALDRDRLLALGAARLDHVRIDGALRQPLGALRAGAGELGGLLLEHRDELAADDLALGLGVAHAGQLAEEQLAGIDADHLGVQLADEHVHHHVAFVQPQQAVVDEDAGQLVADGAMDQRRGHRRIDAARQAEDHLLVAHLLADRLPPLRRCGRASPSRAAPPQMPSTKRSRIACPAACA